MNREILRLAVPNVISNITIPLLGMVDIAIAGRMGHESSIGAIAIGTTIFNFIYWNCGFLRMGTSGLTAQAFGADDKQECANILLRSLMIAVAIAAVLLIVQVPLCNVSLRLMNASESVNTLGAQYFLARIWAVPAAISIFSLHGWFIGMQDSTTPMIVSIVSNLINIACCIVYVFRLNMGIAGIGYAAVTAQWSGLLLSLVIVAIRYRKYLRLMTLRGAMNREKMLRFFNVNRDIFLRTICVVTAYTFFTAASAQWGDTVLAANAILMQLFTFFSYMCDGFGYAAESLTGRFVGARDSVSLRECLRRLIWWSAGVALLFVTVYLIDWRGVVGLFTTDRSIVESVGRYIIWVITVPAISFFPFLVDAVMLGATRTRVLRNTVLLSLVVYFAVYFSTRAALDNSSIWLAFIAFTVCRGVFLFIATKRLSVEWIISANN